MKPADERTAKAREQELKAREFREHGEWPTTTPADYNPAWESRWEDRYAAAYAESVLAEAQRKVVCSFCGTITEYDHTQEHAQADAILAHIETCEKSPVKQLMGALAEIDRLNAERSSAIKEAAKAMCSCCRDTDVWNAPVREPTGRWTHWAKPGTGYVSYRCEAESIQELLRGGERKTMKFIIDLDDKELDKHFPEAGEMDLCDEITDAVKDAMGLDKVKVTGYAAF